MTDSKPTLLLCPFCGGPAKMQIKAALAELREIFLGNELTIDFATRPDGLAARVDL